MTSTDKNQGFTHSGYHLLLFTPQDSKHDPNISDAYEAPPLYTEKVEFKSSPNAAKRTSLLVPSGKAGSMGENF